MTITLTREEAQSVLDAVEDIPHFHNAVIETLRARLEQSEVAREGPVREWARISQAEPEPVAWHEPGAYGNVTVYKEWAKENGWLPLYTAPPQREWQGLTDDERTYLAWESNNGPHCVAMTEVLLKEKNA